MDGPIRILKWYGYSIKNCSLYCLVLNAMSHCFHSLIISFLLGYAVYQLENLDDTKLPVDKEFCLKNRIKVKVGYTNKAEVVGRFQLSPGYYVIIPSTFGPNVDGEFLLRIFSEKALSTAKHLCRFCIQSS